ncbi:replication-associated recombination protein A [Periweissella beninensis]|uniref:Replication-associated recombination protein A n=1 Tax=Periweissella beninensis TaxID=504936 RepID=A0ABT0VJQ6_9LACO|nr:replication-associated recombination protein A [Periweissella beninensis]MBM7544548.1 putative ATPase [Periweissella beninensis]MCM2438047.1 replication-associated recombination protein A [Periweissella beninensis]MCT4395826.1 replication-associated recombination protein A [Periweissella beninensis]
MQQPLAFRMRPKTLAEIVGQTDIIGTNKIINRMVKAKRLSSMILYGPPGTGKTSIASAIAGTTNYAFRILNAAVDSKKELQIVAEEAKISGTVILLLDEIHRLDKAKQDFLLPHLESGAIVLIGATTENPYISISPAIRSRTQIFEVKPLKQNEIEIAIRHALKDPIRGLGQLNVDLTPDAMTELVMATNGDLRSALNSLELAVLSTNPDSNNQIHVTLEIIQDTVQRKNISGDKNGDAHYDVISAFQKSIRGSDVNATLHYLARLIEMGDLPIIIRRLLVIAYEDIGLANPQLAARTLQATNTAEKIGLPEARIPLANIAIELALSPKSNSALIAIDAALNDLHSYGNLAIPAHLKDAHYQGATKLGHGVHYKYPHNYQNDWIRQQYLPSKLKKQIYFKPKGNSNYEKQLKLTAEKLDSL